MFLPYAIEDNIERKKTELNVVLNERQELPAPTMFAKGSGLNEQSLQRAFHRCFLPN